MKTLFAISLFLLFSSCQSMIEKASNKVTYQAYELVGIQKRDLLKTRVDDAKEEQEEAGEDFKDALERLKDVYGFKGGNLEKKYDSLKGSHSRAAKQADKVRKSIRKVETVAADLFQEWEKEINQIETASLKAGSRNALAKTRNNYDSLHAALKGSEARMEPVLKKFNDQVLYLKHNLNAQAISSLKGESLNIQKEIESLIQEMNKSIASAEVFIKEMPKP